MTSTELETLREQIGLSQESMAELLQCDYVGYKRYATGARLIPRYIARSAMVLDFIHQQGLLEELQIALTK